MLNDDVYLRCEHVSTVYIVVITENTILITYKCGDPHKISRRIWTDCPYTTGRLYTVQESI